MTAGPMAADTPHELGIDLRIEDDGWLDGYSEEQLFEMATTALAAAVAHTRGGQVDLLLTHDDEMQTLNRDWRDKDKPTDVLSFPSDDLAFETGFLGDIALGRGVFLADCRVLGRKFEAHFAHLLIHGYLHLLGFDHIDDEEAEEMESLETKILAELGYSDPYSVGDRE